MNTSLKMAFAAATIALATSAQAQTMCVFDLLGAQGDNYSMMKDYAVVAKQWGADIKLKAYTDERVASEDFKAGQCDGVALTGMRARAFNNFTGSIDAIGGLTNNAGAKTVIAAMASPTLAADMIQNGYEVAGVTTLGSAYIMVNDRSINTLAKAAGKRFGVLDYDKAQAKIVQRIGAQPVSVDLLTIGGKFNNGQIDMIGMPAMGFKPLELHKGIGTKGAVIRFPVVQVTGDIVIRPGKFPAGFGQKSRTWIAGQIGREMAVVARTEKEIDAKYWMEIPPADKVGYVKLMREARIDMTKEGIYNKKMMTILKKVRCGQDAASFECALNDE
ncbi:MAG: hypothetical protein H7Z73_11630 [Candidatus Saccharibacteria bacterium]|nr:hypothetical protein [Moraxellaceae bacterium]